MKPYTPVEMAHRVTDMVEHQHFIGTAPTSSWLSTFNKYLPIYTTALATTAVGLAIAEFVSDMNEGPEKIVVVPTNDGDWLD
jgi:hypothetical protein